MSVPGVSYFLYCLVLALATSLFGYLMIAYLFPSLEPDIKLVLSVPSFFFYIYIVFMVNRFLDGLLFSSNNTMIFLFLTPLFMLIYLNRQNYDLILDITNITRNPFYTIFLAIIVAVYSYPIIKSPSGIVWVPGDMGRHFYLINQFLMGVTSTHSVYEGVSSAYPWLFHVITAFLQALCVFSVNTNHRIFMGYNVVSILTVLIGYFAVYGIVKRLYNEETPRRLAVFFAMFSGGFGFLFFSGRYNYHTPVMGDMILGYPYNGTLMNIAPTWPRHLSYSLFLVLLFLVKEYLDDESKELDPFFIGTISIVSSQIAMIQTVPFFVSYFVLFLYFLYKLSKRKIHYGLILIVIATVILISPILVSFLIKSINSGFSTIAQMEPYDFTGTQFIGAIGQVLLFLPFGLYANYYGTRRKTETDRWRVLNMFALTTLGIIVVMIVNTSRGLDWTFLGLEMRQHKVWHLVYPIIAFYAADGASLLLKRIAEFENYLGKKFIQLIPRFHVLSLLFILIIAYFGAGTPVLTSYVHGNGLAQDNIVSEFEEYRQDNLITSIQDTLDQDGVVATVLSPSLSRRVSYFTGGYLMVSDYLRFWINETDNIPTQEARINDLSRLVSNTSRIDRKLEIIDKYNVTHIVAHTRIRRFPALRVSEIIDTTFLGRKYVLYVLKDLE